MMIQKIRPIQENKMTQKKPTTKPTQKRLMTRIAQNKLQKKQVLKIR